MILQTEPSVRKIVHKIVAVRMPTKENTHLQKLKIDYVTCNSIQVQHNYMHTIHSQIFPWK